jgi:glucose-6-phosphate 1-epimerase
MSQHGFARNSIWTVTGTSVDADRGVAVFTLTDNENTRALWNFPFRLTYTVELCGTLRTSLTACNTGGELFQCQMLLHTYLRIGEITNISVTGFQDCVVFDQLSKETSDESSAACTINCEVDRIYKSTSKKAIGDLVLKEPGRRDLMLSTTSTKITQVLDRDGHQTDAVDHDWHPTDVVFWNPWIDKAKGLSDVPDEGFHSFVCIEPGVVQDWVQLKPSDEIVLTQTFQVASA